MELVEHRRQGGLPGSSMPMGKIASQYTEDVDIVRGVYVLGGRWRHMVV